MLALLYTLFGIGFLLFIHEGGHFLAARYAGVRVDVFSLGFGPRLWGFRRGDTDYRICAIPLGGYVKMAGEEGGSLGSDSLLGKSPAWRLLIYSGGILMNFAFALIVIPILFRIGVPLQSPVLGNVEPGEAGWEAGLQEGDSILSIDGRSIHSFSDLASTVALAELDQALEISLLRYSETVPRIISVTPGYNQQRGFPTLGVSPTFQFSVLDETGSEALGVLTEISGRTLTNPLVSRVVTQEMALRNQPMKVVYEKQGKATAEVLRPFHPDSPLQLKLGLYPMHNQVSVVRGPLGDFLKPGDRLLSMNGHSIRDRNELLYWIALAPHSRSLQIQRDGQSKALQIPQLSPQVWANNLVLNSPEGAPFVAVVPDSSAALAGIQTGDQLLWLGSFKDSPLPFLGGRVEHFDDVRQRVNSYRLSLENEEIQAGEPLRCLVLRHGVSTEITLTPSWQELTAARLGIEIRTEIVREANIASALSTGLSQAKSMVRDAFLSMKQIVSGNIAAKNLGGIITIGRATHSFASNGIVPLLFFLCLISIHLAVLNLLPIPALDGGHILFVLYELIFRKPLSEKIQMGFQVVGFFAIVGLMIFVTFLDIQRLF
jgi:regulator of sigma E protease